MSIVRFLKCYSNPIITLLAAILFLVFSDAADVIAEGDSGKLIESAGSIYALGAILFSLLAIWVFTIGALIVFIQLIYGVVKFLTVKDNKSDYLHYFYGFSITIFSYSIIFIVSTAN